MVKSIEVSLEESLVQIERAKQEWEATVDSLSHLVFLLDDQGCILRANRAVERWNLGRVVEVKGWKLHEFLHPNCSSLACYLETFWSQAYPQLVQGQPVEYEIEDSVLNRYLRLQARPIMAETMHDRALDSFAGVVVQDITARKQAEKALQKAHDELERRVEERTVELSKTNTVLKQEIAERERAEEELKQRAAQLTLINELGRQIAAVLELETLLGKAARLIQEIFEYHHVALFLVEGNVLKLKAVAGSYATYFPPDHIQRLNEGINGWVASHGEKILANNVQAEPHYISLIAEYTITQAELCLPIRIAGETVGVLDIQSPHLNAFSENDVVAMETLSSQIAVAIENTRLYASVQQELTERKRAEKALAAERALLAQRVEERTAELSAANAELERAARLKDEFLASMSHELRTPLNTILGMTEVLHENVYGEINEEQQRVVSYVEESGHHLLDLINDILDVAKIEAGKTELLIAPVSVGDVCQTSLLFIDQAAHQKQIKIVSNFDDSVGTIQVDERRLKQILVNLLSNAVKFTPEGGQIGLEVKENESQGVVHFTVWDTGIGIAKENMGRLFKPFVQIDSSFSRQHGGTGLGLSLVYRLTEMHGGGVSLESTIGQGSRFTVSLPWQSVIEEDLDEYEQRNGGIDRQETETPLLYSNNILLAENNETNIATISNYLRLRGYQVIVTRNGSEAIERAEEEKPDLILMDIQMPGMDGLEVIRRIRANKDLTNIPIIALTALTISGDRERCLAAGANEYLSKPVSLKQLGDMIKVKLGIRKI